ncbi:MAG: type IIL restriction-modification enzyme MmeI [Lachnospiraceae bacterium]
MLDERQRKELAQYSPYIAIPKVSSQNRRYIPMDYLEGEIIPGDKLFTMPSATSYEFGILMSNVHMAWTRAVCGRLKSDYSYSNMIVYNNFPWPSPTNDQKEKIRKTAQAILNARAQRRVIRVDDLLKNSLNSESKAIRSDRRKCIYTDSNLADLYDPLTMPTELLKAHKANNRAVMHAYGFSIKMSEADCVAELMRMYQKLTKEK